MRLVGVLLLIALVDTKKVVPRPRRYLTIKGSKCPCWWDLEGKLIDPKTNKVRLTTAKYHILQYTYAKKIILKI